MEGYEKILRDEKIDLIHVYAFSSGKTTNNISEFLALKKGLEISSREGIFLLQVHGA